MFDKYVGHRIYNGCPDSAMKRRWEEEAKQRKEFDKKFLQHGIRAHATFFPMEQKYMVFSDSYKVLSDFFSTEFEALGNALNKLDNGHA